MPPRKGTKEALMVVRVKVGNMGLTQKTGSTLTEMGGVVPPESYAEYYSVYGNMWLRA
jgi:hypothetical protein